MNYLDMATVSERKHADIPRGYAGRCYGNHIPTSHMLRIGSRWHRVFVVCWSNSGTAYVRKGGQRLYIASGEL